MKVLAVASEIFPLIKTGGLADVTGALPIALVRHGVETRTLVPGYGPPAAPKRLIDETDEYLATLERQVDVLMQEGVGLSAATQHVPMPEWRHWAQYDTWHARNVQRQYLAAELRWLSEAASAPSAALKR